MKPQTNIIPLFDTVAEMSRSNLPVIAGPFFPYDRPRSAAPFFITRISSADEEKMER